MTYRVLDETITEKDELRISFGQVHSGVGGTLDIAEKEGQRWIGIGVQRFYFYFIVE